MPDLIPPHGGVAEPINRTVTELPAPGTSPIPVSDADLSTLYRIADGGLSPLTGPMTREEYDRVLDDPRLSCWFPTGTALPHPFLAEIGAAVGAEYGEVPGTLGLNYYRDGTDSVAFHADRELRELDDTIIAIVTLGARRPFLIRPKGGGRSLDVLFHAGALDLGTVLAIGVEVAAILDRLHCYPLLHRDIKPHNIVYEPATRQVGRGARAERRQPLGGQRVIGHHQHLPHE